MGQPGRSGKQGIMGPPGIKGEKGVKGDICAPGIPGIMKGEPGESNFCSISNSFFLTTNCERKRRRCFTVFYVGKSRSNLGLFAD